MNLINKDWSTLKKLMFTKATTGESLKEYEVTGNPVSFETNISKLLKDFVIPFSDVGELTIYRTGKNLLDGTAFANLVASKGGTIDTTNKTISYTGSVANSVGTVMDKFETGIHSVIIKATSTSSTGNVNMGITYTDGTTLAFTFANAAETSGNIYKYITPANKTIAKIYCYWTGGTATVYYDDFGVFKGDVSISGFVAYSGSSFRVLFPEEVGDNVTGEFNAVTGVLTVTSPTAGTHQLDPIPIQTLNGINTIWTDTNGTNTVTYLKRG